YQHRTQHRLANGAQGQGDGQAFGNVLNGDGTGQRQTDGHIAVGEAHADGHAFRDVVQGDGQHEQPDPVQTHAVRAARTGAFMFVGREVVETEHQQHAEAQADHHGQRSGGRIAEDRFGGSQSGQNQGKGTGGKHHAGGEAEHAVLGAGRDAGEEHGQQRAQGGGNKPGSAANEGVAEVGLVAVADGAVDAGGHQAQQRQAGSGQAQGDQRIGARLGGPGAAQFGG